MYSNNCLLVNQRYSVLNNANFKNIIISVKDYNKKIIFSAVEDNKCLLSPKYGTFSNIRVNTTDPYVIKKLINKLLLRLKKNYKDFFLTLPPYFYNQNLKLITNELLLRGAIIEKREVNNHIICSHKNEFSKGNKKKLKKLFKEKFSFRKGSFDELRSAYDIIKENRSLKSYKVSISFEKLEALVKKFNNKFKIWFVSNQLNKPVASAITIDMIENVRYVFYWGDKLRKDTNSPIVLMAHELIKDNIKNKIPILDLGTSSLNGEINIGLKNFKNSLGALDTNKLTLRYKV